MASPHTNHWTTDPEHNDLLNYLIEKAKDAKSPINIKPLSKKYKEESGVAQSEKCFENRIYRLRTKIHTFAHIDTNTKVKLLFALSASVDAKFLKKLKRDVEVDEKKRITHYKANDGTLELNGDHSRSAKNKISHRGMKGSLRSLINSYFKDKNNADAVPKSEKEKDMGNFIEFISEKCQNTDSPLNFVQLAKDFNKHSGISRSFYCIYKRVKAYCREIQRTEFLDTHSKIKQLFGLSVTLDSDYLKKLRTEALVDVDEKNRITNYKANDGTLELRGDHSHSAKCRTAHLESKGSLRSLIINYFETKDDADAVPKNKEEKEMENLIEFITERCENVDSPLNIRQFVRDFNKHFGISRTRLSIRRRIKRYCREIQRVEFLDTHSKVKQLFGLSATVDLDCLENLRKNAVVEVDHKNRIIKYTANDDSLTLRGSHWGSGETKPKRVKKTNEDNVTTSADDSEEESDHEGFNDSSDEHSSEEFDSEFDSDEENNPLDETENLMDPSNKVDECDNETPVRIRSPTEFSNADNFDFDLPTERTSQPEENEMGEDEGNKSDSEITGNASMKTRSGRLSKRRHLNSEFSYNLANSRTAATPRSTDSSTPKPAKQKKIAIEREQATSSSNQSSRSSRPIRRSIGRSPFPSISTEGRIEWKKKINAVKKHDHSDVDKDDENEKRNDHSETNSNEYSREESDSQLHSKNDNDSLDETENLMESSAVDFGNETPVRSRSPPRISIVNDDSDEYSSEEFDSEFYSDDENNHLDETKDLAARSSNQSGSSTISTRRSSRDSYFPSFSTDVPTPEDNPSDYHGPPDHEMEDYDYNPKEDNTPESSSINNRLREPVPSAAEDHNTNIEDQNIRERSDAVAPELHPEKQSLALQKETNSTLPTNGKEVISQEVPIKTENGEPVIVENPTEDVKPEIAHNPKIKFFEAMHSLILFLDTPSLSNLQSKINQKIRKMKGSKEVLQNNELIPALELLVARMTNHSVIDISEGVESVSLIQFFCYLKASILNSKMIGVEGLMNKISGLIEKSQNKRIQMEKVANALRATLDIDGF